VDIHAFWDSKNMVERLILALDHPEPETPIRAAWVLGERREAGAAAALAVLVRKTKDVYLATAAVEALGKIGTREALDFLNTLSSYPARMVREAAKDTLRRHEGEVQSQGKATDQD
jgi:HEAT repeat protein